MQKNTKKYNLDAIKQTHPYFILVDNYLRIIEYSNAMNDLYPIQKNELFSDYFILSPFKSTLLNFENLKDIRQQKISLEFSQGSTLIFQGKCNYYSNKNLILFMGKNGKKVFENSFRSFTAKDLPRDSPPIKICFKHPVLTFFSI